MDMVFVPNSFNLKKAIKQFKNIDMFLECQIKYKNMFEKYLKTIVNFQELDNLFTNGNINAAFLEYDELNFYRRYSQLDSNYFYIRNNFHVENLDKKEIKRLLNDDVDELFIKETFKKVIFEQGDYTFFGIPNDKTEAKSKSLVIGFYYNMLECKSMKELTNIEKLADETFNKIEEIISKKLNIELSFLKYSSDLKLLYEKAHKR